MSVLRTALFWVITQRVAVISYYRRFGTTYRSIVQESVLFARKSKAMFPRLVYLTNAPVIVGFTRNQVIIFFLLPRVVYLANILTLVHFAGCQHGSCDRMAYRRAELRWLYSHKSLSLASRGRVVICNKYRRDKDADISGCFSLVLLLPAVGGEKDRWPMLTHVQRSHNVAGIYLQMPSVCQIYQPW